MSERGICGYMEGRADIGKKINRHEFALCKFYENDIKSLRAIYPYYRPICINPKYDGYTLMYILRPSCL